MDLPAAPPPRPPRRVRVTGPRNRSEPLDSGWRVSGDLSEQAEVAEVFVRSLMRTQFRLGITIVLTFTATALALPLLHFAAPALDDVRLLELPLMWWLLGLCPYPLMIAGAWAYVIAAERADRDFGELAGR